MRWTERQIAMLGEMGLRVWGPAAAAETPVAAAAVAVAGPPGPGAPPVERTRPPAPTPVRPDDGRRTLPPAASAASPKTDAAALQAEAAIGRAAVATMDWPALREAVAGCRACALCERRRHTVFGVGHERAHWMIVGEAPGEQEDLKGEPFVGAAGQLLDRMLAALGLTRSAAGAAQQVFIANTLKCRPPGNRNPQPEELARCQPYLERQVQLVQPRIIVAMGRFAVQTLLARSDPIGRLRGQVRQWRGRPLVVTYHPAYLLRTPADKARAWADLCLAASVADAA